MPSTFGGDTQLSCTVPAVRMVAATVFTVSVQNPGTIATSNTVLWSVLNPAPVLTDMTPRSVAVSTASLTLTFTGTNFLRTSQVLVDSVPVRTTFTRRHNN